MDKLQIIIPESELIELLLESPELYNSIYHGSDNFELLTEAPRKFSETEEDLGLAPTRVGASKFKKNTSSSSKDRPEIKNVDKKVSLNPGPKGSTSVKSGLNDKFDKVSKDKPVTDSKNKLVPVKEVLDKPEIKKLVKDAKDEKIKKDIKDKENPEQGKDKSEPSKDKEDIKPSKKISLPVKKSGRDSIKDDLEDSPEAGSEDKPIELIKPKRIIPKGGIKISTLLANTDQGRKNRAKTQVRTKPLKIIWLSEDQELAEFDFKAFPSTEKKRHWGYVRYINTKNIDTVNELYCSCKDFAFRLYRVMQHKNLLRPETIPKKFINHASVVPTRAMPIKTNPTNRAYVCKHLAAMLTRYF